MNIGVKIRELRKEKQITQEQLAEYLHISSQAVSKWETGASSPDIDMLPKLAVYFGTSLDHLLDFDQSRIDAAIGEIIRQSGRGGGDPARSEAYLRKALEKYPNNDLLLTCILEDMQAQNGDGSRNAEILEIGERILKCTKDDANRVDVYRVLAETCHSMGEQAMAEYYLEKIPGLFFMYDEIAAAVRSGKKRLENAGRAERLCIDKLLCMLWMRREEAAPKEKAALDRQAHEMLDFFRRYPIYLSIAEAMERAWDEGTIPEGYR